MKNIKIIKRIFASILAVITLFAFFTSCKNQNDDDVLSHIGSSEITSSDTATSEPKKDESSKPENSSKPETSSKPKESSKPSVSSKPKPAVTSKPAPTSSKTTSKAVAQTKPNSERILGKWVTTTDISSDLKQQGFNASSPTNVKVYYEFNNNTLTIKIDEASFRSIATPLLKQALIDVISQQYGMTLAEFIAQNNTTEEALINASMDEAVKNLSQFTTYKVDGDTLHLNITEFYQYKICGYSFSGDNKLSISYENKTINLTRVK